MKPSKTDRADLSLLEHLQRDARRSVESLADVAGLSVPACYKRIQRLRAAKLIEREVAVVSPKTMGWPLTMIALVTLEREKNKLFDRLLQDLKAHPQVIEVSYAMGEYDLILKLVAQSTEDYEAMTRELLFSDANIKNFKTLVVMRNVKSDAGFPVNRTPPRHLASAAWPA